VWTYILRRTLLIIPTVWVIATLAFFAVHYIPGDVTDVLFQESPSPEQIAQARHDLGLDRPLLVQYFSWLSALVHGDLGTSWVTKRSVSTDVWQRLPATMELALAGLIVSLVIALPAAMWSATHRGRWSDTATRTAALIGLSVPSFWLGLVLVVIFAVRLHWFSSSGYVSLWEDPGGNLEHLILPAVTLGLAMAGAVTRMLRSSLVEVLNAEFVRVARAKGVTKAGILVHHALRNALIPTITVVGLQVGYLLGGTVVLEQVFNWPGVGQYLLAGIFQRDYPVVLAMMVIYGVIFCLVNLIVDLAAASADPRIRRS
jgi:peptide/nickel transport system permease protein